jgi:hypothetical protein
MSGHYRVAGNQQAATSKILLLRLFQQKAEARFAA